MKLKRTVFGLMITKMKTSKKERRKEKQTIYGVETVEVTLRRRESVKP
uniref:Uncharacterized protein n=1 Tax=Rhizophora mucronata TaxID=61149 RepID=A0A2P2KKG4_RHIMU